MRYTRYVIAAAAVLTIVAAGRASAQETKAKRETQKSLRAEAKIKEADARKTALAEVPNGKVTAHELEREEGKLIYSYDIKVAGKPGVEEVHVDAMTGQMVKHEHEDPKTEAKEKAAKKP